MGGDDRDTPVDIAADSSGDLYVAGTTDSKDFPTTAGVLSSTHSDSRYDAFVFKLSPKGTGGLPGGGADDCVSEEVLTDISQLYVLRKLRDKRMQDENGRKLTALYYRNAAGVKAVLNRNPKLKTELRELLIKNMPVFSQLIASGTATVQEKMLDKIKVVLTEIEAAGDSGLQNNIKTLLQEIDNGTLLKGFGITVKQDRVE